MRLVPAQSRFGRHQRCASRLLSPNFGRGFAAWSGEAGNYWGHNAIMRVAAFRSAAALPVAVGPAPFGGPPLSHDFIEAAWIRRAGWSVELDPDTAGSAEDGPQTLARLPQARPALVPGQPAAHPLSGRAGARPGQPRCTSRRASWGIWPRRSGCARRALRLERGDGHGASGPFVMVGVVLLVPKALRAGVLALAGADGRAAPGGAARGGGELVVSTLLAPLVMVRQTASVLSVLCGRDCGWKSGRAARSRARAACPRRRWVWRCCRLTAADRAGRVPWSGCCPWPCR